jgi:hypothetical protein
VKTLLGAQRETASGLSQGSGCLPRVQAASEPLRAVDSNLLKVSGSLPQQTRHPEERIVASLYRDKGTVLRQTDDTKVRTCSEGARRPSLHWLWNTSARACSGSHRTELYFARFLAVRRPRLAAVDVFGSANRGQLSAEGQTCFSIDSLQRPAPRSLSHYKDLKLTAFAID